MKNNKLSIIALFELRALRKNLSPGMFLGHFSNTEESWRRFRKTELMFDKYLVRSLYEYSVEEFRKLTEKFSLPLTHLALHNADATNVHFERLALNDNIAVCVLPTES